MYIYKKPTSKSFDKDGIIGSIYPLDLPENQWVHISTEKGHETVIRFRTITMTYIVSLGSGVFTINGEDHTVSKDDLIVIPPNTPYTYTGKMELFLLTTPRYVSEDEEEVGPNEQYASYTPEGAKNETDLLRESLARSQADYQNLLMRVERDKVEMVAYLSSKILLPLLKEVDNLERAVKLKEGVEADGFVDGVRSVLAGMRKYLELQGVVPFDSVGQEVDPERHDVMTEAPGPEGKIVTEFERGYLLGSRVLRHAKVVVGSGE